MCSRCQGTVRPIDGRPQDEVQVVSDKLEVVASFCYLGDMLSAAGGYELSSIPHREKICLRGFLCRTWSETSKTDFLAMRLNNRFRIIF